MRLGKKKEKDKELEIRSVDGITRLICLSKGQAPLKGALYTKVSIPLHYQHRRVYLRCIWRCKTQIRFSAVALQNSIILFSSADFADFKEFFNDVVKDVTIKQNLNAISGSISKDTNEAFHCCFDTRFLKKLAFCIVGQTLSIPEEDMKF